MKQLEQITRDVCVMKLKVMRNIVFTEDEEKCQHCVDYNKSCYIPLRDVQRYGIRRGINAVYNFWYHNISIRGMPTEE